MNVQGVYEEAVGFKLCSSTNVCEVNFTVVPAGKDLIVRNLSCMVQTPSATELVSIQAVGSGRKTWLEPVLVGVNGGTTRIYQVNDQVAKVYRAGSRPVVSAQIAAVATLSLECSLSGELKAI